MAWTAECEEAFQQLKKYLANPPLLSTPVLGEALYIYLVVSPTAVSSVLVREDMEVQRPVYYTSKALVDAETRYPATES